VHPSGLVQLPESDDRGVRNDGCAPQAVVSVGERAGGRPVITARGKRCKRAPVKSSPHPEASETSPSLKHSGCRSKH